VVQPDSSNSAIATWVLVKIISGFSRDHMG
jgi:hypothetical protein